MAAIAVDLLSPAAAEPQRVSMETQYAPSMTPVPAGPIASCESLVAAADSEHRDAPTLESDEMEAPYYLAKVEECYFARRDFANAAKQYPKIGNKWASDLAVQLRHDASGEITWTNYALVLDHIALSFERLGDLNKARTAIRMAHQANSLRNEAVVEKDYQRLDRRHIADESRAERAKLDSSLADAEQRRLAQLGSPDVRVARSRRFWDACSAAQRKILVERGGKGTNRDHNVGDGVGPKRIETFETARYLKETWWYYGLGHAAEAYTFVNGRLESYYAS
jgi:hypothetical protein